MRSTGRRALGRGRAARDGGGRRAGRQLLGAGDVLVWNADILAAIDPRPSSRRTPPRARPRLWSFSAASAARAASGLDPAGRVVRLRGERVADESTGGEFLGVHVMGDELRGVLPDRGCLVGDVYIPALRRGVTLQAFAWDGPFFDIGDPRSYLEANLAWLATKAWCLDGPRRGVGPASRRTTLLGPARR